MLISLTRIAILKSLATYHYLTARQVCRIRFSPGSLTFVQTQLKGLVESGYCQRLFLPRPSQSGSAPAVHRLSRQGLNYLQREGIEVAHRYRPSEEREHSYLFLAHTLSVNDFLIGLDLLARRMSQVELHTMHHERTLKREPQYVTVGNEQIAVIPDGWIDLRVNGQEQMCIALEVDRGSEEQKRFRRKVRGLVAWAQGPYEERFHTESLTIAVVAVPGDPRLADLVRWTESELEALDRKQDAEAFWFLGGDPAALEPEEMFLSPRWIRPFDHEPRALLEGIS